MTKVMRWGDNVGIKIPVRMARALRLEHGSEVALPYDRGRLILEPIRPVLTLDRLLSEVTRHNAHHDLDWRPADDRDGPWAT